MMHRTDQLNCTDSGDSSDKEYPTDRFVACFCPDFMGAESLQLNKYIWQIVAIICG